MQTTGSHAQVYHGTAKHTSGGLTKKDLVVNKHGRIVSRKKMMQGKKALKYLIRAGYKAKKGSFKLFHKGHKTAKKSLSGRGKTAKKFF
jgi:hypothetical protein